MSTTTTKPVELCIGVPEAYDGSFEKATAWFNTVAFYLITNEGVYKDDAKKIAFVLSFMTKGTAATWAATFHAAAISTGTMTAGIWADFQKAFETTFKWQDTVGDAIAWLTTTKMVKQRQFL